MTSYRGPDREFGEHDDYAIGDVVHTYDNEEGAVTLVRDDAYGRDYRVATDDGRERTYDGSRLALVRRAPASEVSTERDTGGDASSLPTGSPVEDDVNPFAADPSLVPDAGGYNVFGVTDDGATLCYRCIVDPTNPVHDERHWPVPPYGGDGWGIVAFDIDGNVDGPLYCDHCSAMIVEDPDGDQEDTDRAVALHELEAQVSHDLGRTWSAPESVREAFDTLHELAQDRVGETLSTFRDDPLPVRTFVIAATYSQHRSGDWNATGQVPTFTLRSDVGACPRTVEEAEKVARTILEAGAAPGTTFYVSAGRLD